MSPQQAKQHISGREILLACLPALTYLLLSLLLQWGLSLASAGITGALDSVVTGINPILHGHIFLIAGLLSLVPGYIPMVIRLSRYNRLDKRDKCLYILRLLYAPALILISYYVCSNFFILQQTTQLLMNAALLLCGQIALLLLPRQITLYLFFGAMTTIVAQLSFNLSNLLFFGTVEGGGGFYWVFPQAISWILAVLFAFFSNRIFVFSGQKGALLQELGRFFLARAATGLAFEYLGMFVLMNLLNVAEAWAKLTVSILVILVNYVASRLFVFAEGEKGNLLREKQK